MVVKITTKNKIIGVPNTLKDMYRSDMRQAKCSKYMERPSGLEEADT